MNRKNEKVSYDFDEDFKSLPLKERVEVIEIARDLLEFQREHGVFVGDGEDRVLEDGE